MQKWVWIFFFIQVRPFVYFKSRGKVKVSCLGILLFDGSLPYIVMVDPIFQKLSVQSVAWHYQAISGYPHKGNGLPGFPFGNDEMFCIVQR